VWLTLGVLPTEPLVSLGLMGNDILISHVTNASAEEAEQLIKGGAHVSSTSAHMNDDR